MGYWHARAAERAGAAVVAIVDSNPRRAQSLATHSATAKPYVDLDRAVAEQSVDVTHICTPSSTHATLASRALRLGTHVLVEKPLAESASVTAELLDLATETGRFLCPVHQYLFQPAVRRLLRDLTALGPLVHVDATIFSAGGVGKSQSERDQIAGEILPHPLSFIARMFPDRWMDRQWSAIHPAPGEIRLLDAVGATSISIQISLSGRPTQNELCIVGQSGTTTIDLFHGFRVSESGRVSRLTKGSRPFSRAGKILVAATLNLAQRAARQEFAYPGLWELTKELYVAIQRGTAVPVSPTEALAVAEMRDALLSLLQIDPAISAF